jgi:hypothetical protein
MPAAQTGITNTGYIVVGLAVTGAIVFTTWLVIRSEQQTATPASVSQTVSYPAASSSSGSSSDDIFGLSSLFGSSDALSGLTSLAGLGL